MKYIEWGEAIRRNWLKIKYKKEIKIEKIYQKLLFSTPYKQGFIYLNIYLFKMYIQWYV